jgi:hypothetical protein
MQKIALVQAMENKKYETSSPNLIPANTPIHAPMTLATSKEAQASALADLLREVRIKYKASFKSANKQRRSNPAGNTDVALAAFLTAPWQIDPSSHFLDKQTFKNSNVGNCSELAIYAKNLAINKGFSAHLHGFSTVDHAFTYIEDLRGPSHIGWVIDPWANIVARHTEYAQKLIDKMHKWESDTKHIYDQGVWKLPTDPGWLNGIAQLYKEGEVRVEKDAAYKRTYNTEFVAQLAPLRISRPPSTHSAAP